MAGLGHELTDGPPQDGVSSLRFASHADLLLVSSWDCTVRLYDATLGTCTTTLKHTMPVLDATWVVRLPSPARAVSPRLLSSDAVLQAPDLAVRGVTPLLCRTPALLCVVAWTSW